MFCLLGILYGSLYSFTFCKISPKNAENGISGILDFKIFRGGILLDPYKAPHFDMKSATPPPTPPHVHSPIVKVLATPLAFRPGGKLIKSLYFFILKAFLGYEIDNY